MLRLSNLIFSKYDSNLKENIDEKMHSINTSMILLTIGCMGIAGYFLHANWKRKAQPQTPPPPTEKEELKSETYMNMSQKM